MVAGHVPHNAHYLCVDNGHLLHVTSDTHCTQFNVFCMEPNHETAAKQWWWCTVILCIHIQYIQYIQYIQHKHNHLATFALVLLMAEFDDCSCPGCASTTIRRRWRYVDDEEDSPGQREPSSPLTICAGCRAAERWSLAVAVAAALSNAVCGDGECVHVPRCTSVASQTSLCVHHIMVLWVSFYAAAAAAAVLVASAVGVLRLRCLFCSVLREASLSLSIYL